MTDHELIALSRKAMQNAYAPYSKYKVGAALLCSDGQVFLGCNIENASFGLTNCAERVAIGNAITHDMRDFSAIAISSEKAMPYPCGACRQVLREFCPDIRVLISTTQGKSDEVSLEKLLPHSFGPDSL